MGLLDKNKTDKSECPIGNKDEILSCPHGLKANESSTYSPQNSKDHKLNLSTERVKSSIPLHDETGEKKGNWVYPSEQMFYEALRRKNWNPDERDIPMIVPIHNAINEECWRQILEWESLHNSECENPKLYRFEGKPKMFSIRARVWMALGYKPPFDRHDWTVDRCGKKVEYIIDFYSGKPNMLGTSFYVDIRPKLTFEGFIDRISMGYKRLIGKIFE